MMVNTLTISTLANAAIGIGYFYLASKLPGMDLNTRNQLGALCLSAIAQGIFIQRKEAHPQDISNIETISRYSFPYVLIGGASLCATNSTLKANAIAGILLGTAQVLVSEVSSRYMDNKINSSEFGLREWKEYLNVDVPAVEKPENIEQILNARCPFWGDQGKKVRDTHMLVLIPATVNERPFNLNELNELINDTKNGYKAKLDSSFEDIKDDIGIKNIESESSYWVLMTKEMVPNSSEKEYMQQEIFIGQKEGYEIPSSLEAATCIFTHYVRRGHCLYKSSKYYKYYCTMTTYYTVCKDSTNNSQIILGNFGSQGNCLTLSVIADYFTNREIYPSPDSDFHPMIVGAAGLRKL